MWLVIIGAVVVLLFLGTRKAMGNPNQWLVRHLKIQAIQEGVEPAFLIAIAAVESGGGQIADMDPYAYNPEGYPAPAGMPDIGRHVPPGTDLTGYQGSFGLCQIYHSDQWSTARAYGTRISADYPNDLMDPIYNAEVAARFIADLMRKGFNFPDQADVFNLGETKYALGKRSDHYIFKVKRVYEIALRI